MPSFVSISVPLILIQKTHYTHPAIILIIVHKKSKKPLMTVLTVAPTTNAKKQQTNELSSILSRYLINTSFKCITATQNMDRYTHIEKIPASTCMLLAMTCHNLLTSSCTVHRLKFPCSPRYILTLALLCYFVSLTISKIKACIKVPICRISTF